MELKINQKFKDLIPPLTAEEFEQLETNCLNEGIRDKIVTWNGYIIDGHNRYEIATRHGLEFATTEAEYSTEEEVIEWMILNQFGRRNLSNYQRSVLALQLENLFAKKAEANLKLSGENYGKGLQKSAKPIIEKVDTRKELAKVAQVSHDTIQKVKKIESKAAPEIKQKLQTGEMSINQAYEEIKKEEKIEEIKAKKERENVIAKQVKFIDSYDFVKNASILDSKDFIPENIKALITDPPYGQGFISNRRVINEKDKGIKNDDNLLDALDLLDETLSMVYDKMMDNSFAFVFTSWRYEPQFRNIFEKYFTLKNSLIWVKRNHGSGDLEGSFAPKHERILFGVKGKPKLNYRIPDVIEGSEIVTKHPTSKPIDLLQELIKICTSENDIIFEPFGGHGSTFLAGLKLKRQVYGTELDEENYNFILKNIKEKIND